MRLSQYIERKPVKRRKTKRDKPSVASHGSFVPMVTVWGASLLGLSVMVLPDSAIGRFSAMSGLGTLDGMMRYALAGSSALLSGGLAFAIAKMFHAQATRQYEDHSIAKAFVDRRVRPIDPATDLGSDSLDAPLETTPFSHDDASDDYGDRGLDARDAGHRDDDDDWDPPAGGDRDHGTQSPETGSKGPTLGELSKRGYQMEAPEDAIEQAGGWQAKPKKSEWAFTHKQFQDALIESCEGATCEADPSEAAEPVSAPAPSGAAPQRGPDAPVAEAQIAPVAPLVIKPRKDTKPGAIGRPAGGNAWSLTQFNPDDRPPADPKPAAETQPPAQAAPAPLAEKPRELDLAEFAEVPGRNAVWVEEEVQQTAPSPQAETPPEPAPVPANALEKLRQTPAAELSLVEMVERFAGALHEHQQSERAQAETAKGGRDAALAEALKALTLFTENGFNAPTAPASSSQLHETERELRDALSKLQTLRGAA